MFYSLNIYLWNLANSSVFVLHHTLIDVNASNQIIDIKQNQLI